MPPTNEEVLVKNEMGQLLHDTSTLLAINPRNTGLIASSIAKDRMSSEVMDLISACRVSQSLGNRFTVLSDDFLPSDESSLNFLDHLVIAENRLVDDFAALAAVRRWLNAGGRLWIMLDRVDPVILERLLGDDFHGTVVDRVGLTTVRIDRAPLLMDPRVEIGETVEYEEPVQMARVVIRDMTVVNSVNGWPASLTRQSWVKGGFWSPRWGRADG